MAPAVMSVMGTSTGTCPHAAIRLTLERLITTRRRPDTAELAELAAIRRELVVRATRRAPMRWWAL
jgi:hypothetical protein